MKTIQVLLLLSGMVGVSSCGVPSSGWSSLVSGDPGYDVKHDAQGNATLLDTPRMWEQFKQTVDFGIAQEKSGGTHWGTSKNANDAWISTIHNNQTGREHPQKYIDYIVEQRRKAGLPELVGYP